MKQNHSLQKGLTTRHIVRKKLGVLLASCISKELSKVVNSDYFDFWERKGFHIQPIHFHEPVPDTRTLKQELWTESKLVGVNLNVQAQLNFLNQIQSYKKEYRFPHNPTSIPHEYYFDNAFFPPIDAEVLYVLVRQYKPKRIIEVGSGFSTYLMAKACLKNYEETRKETDYTVIDPYPNATVSKGVPGVSRLIAKPVEQVPIETFLALDENDFFFIDSSHVARIGGDVNYELLEILPRLNKGVVVHLHDIFLPYEYPKQFIFGFHRFWTEQYLLQSFLTLNFAFEVLWSGFYMYMKYPDECRATFPSFRENKEGGPASFWIRRKV